MQTIGSSPARQRRLGLGPHDGVGLAMVGAALGMADDHVAGAGIAQHLGGDVAGMGAARLGVAVLAAHQHAAALHRLGDRHHQGRGRADQHLAVGPAGLLHAVGDALRQRQRIGLQAVHLPVAGNQRAAGAGHGYLILCSQGV